MAPLPLLLKYQLYYCFRVFFFLIYLIASGLCCRHGGFSLVAWCSSRAQGPRTCSVRLSSSAIICFFCLEFPISNNCRVAPSHLYGCSLYSNGPYQRPPWSHKFKLYPSTSIPFFFLYGTFHYLTCFTYLCVSVKAGGVSYHFFHFTISFHFFTQFHTPCI